MSEKTGRGYFGPVCGQRIRDERIRCVLRRQIAARHSGDCAYHEFSGCFAHFRAGCGPVFSAQTGVALVPEIEHLVFPFIRAGGRQRIDFVAVWGDI